MKLNMKKRLNFKMVVGLFCFFSVGLVKAQHVSNIYDGTHAYCPEPGFAKYFDNEKVMKIYVEKGALVIQASVCVNHKLIKDKNLKFHAYKSPEGVKVVEHYSQFEVFIQSKDLSHMKKFVVPHFEDKSEVRFPLSQLKLIDSEVVDVTIQSARRTKTNTGYDFTDTFKWGTARVFIKK